MNDSAATIRDSHILVVGCGALGNEVLKNLVLMGVGHLVVIDFDYVEQGNLTRSILFRRSDVGRRKVDVARDTLLSINPDLDIHTIFGDVAYDIGLGLIRRMDVIVGCVDSRWARYCIQRLCLRAGKTWVDGGILDLTGSVKVFRPGQTCYSCSLSTEALNDLRRRMPCAGVIRRREESGHAPTTPLIASIIGAVQAQEAIRVLGDNAEESANHLPPANPQTRMFSYEGESLTVCTPIFQAWDEDCPLHEEWHDTDSIRLVSIDPDATVASVLQDDPSSVVILNESFVDYIVSRRDDRHYSVMLPAHRVGEYIDGSPLLRGYLYSEFYQHEYREIDSAFPYPDVTFRELGIPEEEILRIRTKSKINI